MTRRAVFLDRDGTVTKYKGFLTDTNQVELEKGAASGIKILNEAGFLVIVVTNQPQVARGMCTEEEIKRINQKMIELLAKEGAHIDGAYFCPHHPEKHHPDIPPGAMQYRIECECRKPNIGMLETAATRFGIDLKNSFVIGDRTVDVQTGKNAGSLTLLVKTGEAGNDGKYKVAPDFEADNLEQAAKLIVMQEVCALILAGGRGERLRPLTDSIPKPMVEIAGKPLLEHLILSLRQSGIVKILICGSYLIEKIKEYFGTGERFGVRIQYPEEREQLGTGGAVKNAAPFFRKATKLLILNGDKMIGPEFDFYPMLKFDAEKNGFCTILVRETDHPEDSDTLRLDNHQKVIQFLGRGQAQEKISNSGMFVVSPEIVDFIPEGVSNIEKDVIFKLADTKEVYGFLAPNHWFIRDIGTPERLELTRKRFAKG